MEGTNGKLHGLSHKIKQETLAIVPVINPECIQSIGASVFSRNSCPLPLPAPTAELNQAKTMMPVNIKQINDAWMDRKPSYIVINNSITSTVKIIGRVFKQQVDEYMGSFTVDDCTGVIESTIWFTNGRRELDSIREGSYAMVVGRIKLEGTKPELLCYFCHPVSNFNDITHHHLSVIAVHIDLVFKPEKTVHARVAEMWKADKEATEKKKMDTSTPKAKRPNSALACVNHDSYPETVDKKGKCIANRNHISCDAEPTSGKILELLRDEAKKAGPEGVHIDVLCAKLVLNRETIRDFTDDLATAGELYTTIDADHLAPT